MKVVTAVVNNPLFIEIQYHTLRRYMKCEYEFIVFNDAKGFPDFTNGGDITIRTQITDICKKYGITCVEIPNDTHKTLTCAARRCADANNYILKYQLENPDKYLCIDSDMFLIDDFDVSYFNDRPIAIVLQTRGSTNYCWNGIYYFDIPKLQRVELLDWSVKPNLDVGAGMEAWLNLVTGSIYPSIDDMRWKKDITMTDNIYYIRHLWSCSWDISELPDNLKARSHLQAFLETDPRNIKGKYFAEIYENRFFHYRAGGNWRKEGMDLHVRLTHQLRDVLMGDM